MPVSIKIAVFKLRCFEFLPFCNSVNCIPEMPIFEIILFLPCTDTVIRYCLVLPCPLDCQKSGPVENGCNNSVRAALF